MKLRYALLSFALVIPLGGCRQTVNTSQPPAALAPGYNNPQDQQIGEALAAARGFYVSIDCATKGQGVTIDRKNCDPTKVIPVYAPSAAEKSALNSFSATLNTANAAYLTYHANPTAANESTASLAAQKVQQQQNALQPTIPGVS